MMGDFYTSYDTEKGRVILQIPTDATTDDMALIQDMLNLIKAVLDKRRADTPQMDCSTCKYDDAEWFEGNCDDCVCGNGKPSNYVPKQTDCPWK